MPRDERDSPVPPAPFTDFLEQPVFTPAASDAPSFQPEEILADRFRIISLIGRGGMGEVYHAYDIELDAAVALKTIRAAASSDALTIERFRREVLRARSVSHPHVCRVFDLFAHTTAAGATVRFLTMELIAGETLAAYLARSGPLGDAETLTIANQVASALDEAHRLQIVHRDLKPGNIMLTGGTPRRAIITDFGLALHLPDGSDQPSEPYAGTDGYMAPEQRAHGTATPASDVYAFGVVLHEMLTGRLPDRDGGVDAPSRPAALLPRRWQRAIGACLERAPERRPGTATEALRMASKSMGRRTPLLALAVAALVVAALSTPALRFDRWGEVPTHADVLLADFSNATGEQELDVTAELLRRQLEQSAFLNVLSSEQVREWLRQMVQSPDAALSPELAREVLWRRGDGFAVSGRLRRADSGYVITLRLEARGSRPDASGPFWSRSYEVRDRNGLRDAIRRGAVWVRATVGERAEEIPARDRPVEEVTTSSWEALDLYVRAQRLLAQSRQEDALALLREAVRVDQDFALAWMRLGDVLISQRRLDEGHAHWTRALSVSGRRQLTEREGLRIRGLYASDTEDFEEAERVYRLYLLSYPNDPAPYFYIARPLLMLGRVDEAVQMLETGAARDGGRYFTIAHLAMYSLRAGRMADAARHIERLRAMGHGEWADCIQASADFLTGDFDGALRRFERLEKGGEPLLRSRSTALQAAVLADTGRRNEAVARLDRGIASDLERGARTAAADKLLAKAALLLEDDRNREARDACLHAEQLDRAAPRLVTAGTILARAGFPADAERLLATVDATSSARHGRKGRLRLSGEILLARGNARRAWTELQNAAALEGAGVMPEYLARAAEAAGEVGVALALYERMARSPAYYWRYPDSEPPGAWASGVANYLRLARRDAPPADMPLAVAAVAPPRTRGQN